MRQQEKKEMNIIIKRLCMIANGILLVWFFLDMVGVSFGKQVLVTRSWQEDGIFFAIFVATFAWWGIKENSGKIALLSWLALWFATQFYSHWYFTIAGPWEGKQSYFNDTIKLIPSSEVYIPDLYHIVLHLLILFALICTLTFTIKTKKQKGAETNKFETRSATSYNKKAEDYDNTFDGQFTQKFKTLLVDNVELHEGMHVLDVACGNGRLLNMLEEKCAIHGYGVDISDKMVEQAQKLNPEMRFVAGRCEELPFEDTVFDVITVSAAYHHFPDVKSFANEAYRLMKPQGKIYIADVYYPWAIRTIANPFVRFSKAGDVKFYSPKAIMATLAEAGFQEVQYFIDGHVQMVSAVCR